ncbi:MAG: NYN domain-containing protein [Actinomyces sp.]|nr:MAG: NYN domain-containing protein [Actinomyces sp.]
MGTTPTIHPGRHPTRNRTCPRRRGRTPAPTTTPTRHRGLVLVDAENLAGTAEPDPGRVRRDAALVRALAPVDDADQVIVACSHHAAPAVWWAWPRALRRARSGPDGADLALLDAVAALPPSATYDHLVIASGDGIFATLALDSRRRGIRVVVLARSESLSTRLARCAHRVILLDAPGSGTDPTAIDLAA